AFGAATRFIAAAILPAAPVSSSLASIIGSGLDGRPPDMATKVSYSISCVVLAMGHLRGKGLLQNHEGLHLPRGQLLELHSTEPPPDETFLDQRLALAADVRLRARAQRDLPSHPNQRSLARVRMVDPSAASFSFQAGLPAHVAIPAGLVGILKM